MSLFPSILLLPSSRGTLRISRIRGSMCTYSRICVMYTREQTHTYTQTSVAAGLVRARARATQRHTKTYCADYACCLCTRAHVLCISALATFVHLAAAAAAVVCVGPDHWRGEWKAASVRVRPSENRRRARERDRANACKQQICGVLEWKHERTSKCNALSACAPQ